MAKTVTLRVKSASAFVIFSPINDSIYFSLTLLGLKQD